jgi:ElaB/YqjD/DUF883 family membrane-anchored ribosome-binding protein
MFHRRSSAAAIEHHLRAIENELGRIGRNAGRQASARAFAVGDQIGNAVTPILSEITPILSEIADRLRSGRRVATDEAARFGNEAVKFGGKIGNDALDRIAMEVETRPLVTLAVAIGVGILIGIAGRRR